MDTKSIATHFTLGKHERLKSRKLIAQLFDNGKSVAAFPIRALYSFTPTPSGLQAGFTVSSKNFKKAVDRNRIKRLMREAYRLQKKELEKKLVVVHKNLAIFFMYTGKELPDYKTCYEKMSLVLKAILNECAS
ncbi:MAG TPA: ribonuclease P protein component [Flavitalea sp.]|nr:ribonuclease P protein component [Flavitalea sp.]